MTTLTTIANLDTNQETIKNFLNYGYYGYEYYYNDSWRTDSNDGEAVQDKKQVDVLQGRQYFDILFEHYNNDSSKIDITKALIKKATEKNETVESFQDVFDDIDKIIAFIQDEGEKHQEVILEEEEE